ncbi:glycoside hydrolase family 65 protein [Rhodanobacter glycinis]|uniref:Glycoside hydrolase family 65 protein n=1 Tax=Rhodanobacter glycinis TaxID=582702 RepID=A0A502FHR4_9GAMM|nr:glycosyl hydrolase family 65 protein [Rhodanobacter glycinis]TPG11295.1 glycoside hydrolase family 65 protein [Rhodanobacter glycinis]TPG48786.1 glycoside hydrolase family 65 protein [Rhodanobacter glycinis]
MKRRHQTFCRLIALGACGVAAIARGQTDQGFLLTATAKDFTSYFPGQLANGYLSTLTAPRGTEGNLAYLVAFMDYAKDDIARPAAIPGWTEIDYSTGQSAAGHFWMNQVDLSPAVFQDYRQTLNLHDATLTTRYRYLDHGKTTAVEVTTFVSQASPHLAATRLSITPDFDGEVELSFALNTWAPHQPRFALGKLSGEQMQEQVASRNLKLQAIPPATPDRAPLWYHGDTHVLDSDGDAHDLTLQLDGRAEQGLTMAEAAAIQLPDGVKPRESRFYRSDYRLALNLRVPVRKGVTYAFTKYVAASREGWGGDAAADLALAKAARGEGFATLLAAHQAAWHELWQTDIRIDGDPQAQRIVHSDLYYLLSNSTRDTAWPIGACGMTTGYAGHAFWDSDSWVFPALLLLHPQRAKSLVMFRSRTLPAAEQRARERGLRGAMYPWEADPQNGSEQTPHFAYVLGEREIHVNADIAIAQWQYYLASGDRAWLEQHGWPVIRAVAQFWASRVTYNAPQQRYEILHVTSVDEDYNDVPNDTFTNVSAAKALRIASAAAKIVGATPDPRWADIAARMYVPFSEKDGHHLDFDPSVPHDIDSWGGSALPMLAYPSLDLPMDATLRRRDFDYALAPITQSHRDPNSMGLAPTSIAAATLGDGAGASAWFQRNITANVLKPPFNVRTETAGNNTGYFLTAAGGLLQNIVYGFSGLRIEQDGLVEAYAPMLPPQWKSLTLRRIAFRGKLYDIAITRDANGKVRLNRTLRATP